MKNPYLVPYYAPQQSPPAKKKEKKRRKEGRKEGREGGREGGRKKRISNVANKNGMKRLIREVIPSLLLGYLPQTTKNPSLRTGVLNLGSPSTWI